MTTVAKKINMANWFEIPVKDLERAAKFYEKVFDVKLSPEDRGGNENGHVSHDPGRSRSSGGAHAGGIL
jgi:predicted enzyme related to lactoylglutathione lyase